MVSVSRGQNQSVNRAASLSRASRREFASKDIQVVGKVQFLVVVGLKLLAFPKGFILVSRGSACALLVHGLLPQSQGSNGRVSPSHTSHLSGLPFFFLFFLSFFSFLFLSFFFPLRAMPYGMDIPRVGLEELQLPAYATATAM